jgi:hypothetical protein
MMMINVAHTAEAQSSHRLQNLFFQCNFSSQIAFAQARLHQFETVMQTEFALLFDKAGRLLIAPHNMTLRGRVYDPAIIVAETLKTGVGYTRTGLIGVSDLEMFNVPRWHTKYLNSTRASALHPYDSGVEGLIRWTTTAMFIDGPDNGTPADGV